MKNVPKLRFKEFGGEYIEYKLSELIKRYSEKNSDNAFNIEDILSLSSIHGIVDRKELLEDTYSKVNHTNYLKTKLHDFVYGKSISASYPYGLFKVNNCRDGLLSTLYFTFRTFENVSPQYLDKYFSHLNRANNFLKKYVLVGDRYITADSNYILSGKIFIPRKKEQEKIVSLLTSIDTKIEQLTKKKELLKQYKRGVMQKVFSQEIRFRADDGGEFGEWEEKKLEDYGILVNGLTYSPNDVVDKGLLVLRSSNIQNNQISYNDNVYVRLDVKDVSLTQENDILICVRNGSKRLIGKNILIPKNIPKATHGAFMTIYRGDSNKFLAQWFQSSMFFKQVYINLGATINSINGGNLKKFKVILPSSKEEQTKIANFLSSIDAKIEQAQKQLNATKEFKKALLQQMFV